jgi:23S rRNA (guanosine2251-2'-O)-methyltransferase
LNYAEELAIRVIYGSENDLWRMSRNNSNGTPDILCLVGRNPESSMDEVLSKGGLIWLLAGASYPVNIGFCIRTAEVSGADAVVIDAELNNQERSAAKRASMKAHRFLPLFWTSGVEFILKAREYGFRIISVEDIGDSAPWDVDMTGDVILVVGGERNGISENILKLSDDVIKIPMSGFVPSFNLQAPLSYVAIEAQRQRS